MTHSVANASSTPLQYRLDALKAEMRSKVSPEAHAIMQKATEDLVASGLARRALCVGTPAPIFSLPDASDQLFRSADHIARGPLVISFYRGMWCPYCNLELEALQASLGSIRQRGAELAVISPQTAVNSRRAIRTRQLDFPILVDKGNALAAQFGLRFRLPDDLQALYLTFGNNLPLVNGEDSWSLPMPARFVIGTDGIVHYAEVNPDYSVRPDPQDLLPVLDRLAATAQP